jgi:hypothetical protein
LNVDLQAQSTYNLDHGGDTGVAVGRKRPVKALTGKPSMFSYLGHIPWDQFFWFYDFALRVK